MEIIHTILHPVFTVAVRDGLIRSNPTEGVMAEIKKSHDWEKGKRHALTIPQQSAFITFISNSKQYQHWLPIFTLLLGTGCRVGEAVGLRWEDCDFNENIISGAEGVPKIVSTEMRQQLRLAVLFLCLLGFCLVVLPANPFNCPVDCMGVQAFTVPILKDKTTVTINLHLVEAFQHLALFSVGSAFFTSDSMGTILMPDLDFGVVM